MNVPNIAAMNAERNIATNIQDGDVIILYRPTPFRGDEYLPMVIGRDNLQNSAGIIKSGRVEVSASELRTGHSLPITLVAAAGAGTVIEGITASIKYTSGDGLLSFSDAEIGNESGAGQLWLGGTFNSGADAFTKFSELDSDTIQYVENKRLWLKLDSDSGSGTGTATIYFTYRIITL